MAEASNGGGGLEVPAEVLAGRLDCATTSDRCFVARTCQAINFLRTLATPEPIKGWPLTSLEEKLIKIGAKLVSHGRYVAFRMAEVAVPRMLFVEILRMIAELRPGPDPAPA